MTKAQGVIWTKFKCWVYDGDNSKFSKTNDEHENAGFRTGLIFTIGIPKQNFSEFQFFDMKTAQFCSLLWSMPTRLGKPSRRRNCSNSEYVQMGEEGRVC